MYTIKYEIYNTYSELYTQNKTATSRSIQYMIEYFDVFLTMHHSIVLFHLPTLMHNSFIH